MHQPTGSILRQAGRQVRQWARCGLLALPLAAGLASEAQAGFTVFDVGGIDAAAITPTRDAFRTAVGGGGAVLPALPNGDFGGMRREINWDGVPDIRSDPNALPANFFNVNSPRGVVFSSPTPGATFLVSSKAATSTPILFGFPNDLQTFSNERLFATVGSRITDIHFFVPGPSSTAVATTSAFAAVFVDAETTETTMEFFDVNDALIFTHSVTAVSFHPDGSNRGGLSFLGGVANAGERIARVRITTPDNFLMSNGVRANEDFDFVVMDDFLYATPAAVPEPEVWAMILLGLGVVGWRSRRRV